MIRNVLIGPPKFLRSSKKLTSRFANKNAIFKKNINYLGHDISDQGIKILPGKLKPILDCPSPSKLHQLRFFLCMIAFSYKHIPLLSAKLTTLYNLLKKMLAGIGRNIMTRNSEMSSNY